MLWAVMVMTFWELHYIEYNTIHLLNSWSYIYVYASGMPVRKVGMYIYLPVYTYTDDRPPRSTYRLGKELIITTAYHFSPEINHCVNIWIINYWFLLKQPEEEEREREREKRSIRHINHVYRMLLLDRRRWWGRTRWKTKRRINVVIFSLWWWS